jgi:hypothetical protein
MSDPGVPRDRARQASAMLEFQLSLWRMAQALTPKNQLRSQATERAAKELERLAARFGRA